MPEPTLRPAVCQSQVQALDRLGYGVLSGAACWWLQLWGAAGLGQIQNKLLSICAV